MDFRKKPTPLEVDLRGLCTKPKEPSAKPMGFSRKFRWFAQRYFRFLTTGAISLACASGWYATYSRTSLKQASKLELAAQRLGSVVEAYERLRLFPSCLPFRTSCGGFRVFSSGVFVFEVRVVVPFRPCECLSSLWMGKWSWQIVPSK